MGETVGSRLLQLDYLRRQAASRDDEAGRLQAVAAIKRLLDTVFPGLLDEIAAAMDEAECKADGLESG